jgi:hypothetical protein
MAREWKEMFLGLLNTGAPSIVVPKTPGEIPLEAFVRMEKQGDISEAKGKVGILDAPASEASLTGVDLPFPSIS